MRNFLYIIVLCALAIYFTSQRKNPDNFKKMSSTAKQAAVPGNAEEEADFAGTVDSVQQQTGDLNSEFSDQIAEQECIFDPETQTDEFVKNIPGITSYSWNDTSKTATILLPGDEILYATRGGC